MVPNSARDHELWPKSLVFLPSTVQDSTRNYFRKFLIESNRNRYLVVLKYDLCDVIRFFASVFESKLHDVRRIHVICRFVYGFILIVYICLTISEVIHKKISGNVRTCCRT